LDTWEQLLSTFIVVVFSHAFVAHLRSSPRVRYSIALDYLIPTFGAHRVLSSKTTLIMSPRRVSQHLHPDEGLLETSPQNRPPLHHPSTQILSTITEGSRHSTFDDIPEVQLHQPANNMSTTTVASSQNGGGVGSTQTNGGAPQQSPLWAPSPIQVIQEDMELEQVQLQD
jgi:hypothetical protein